MSIGFTVPWTRQPQLPVRLRSDIWTPDYFWAQNNGPSTSGRKIITRGGSPGTVTPTSGGIGIGHNGTSQYENYAAPLSSGYPFIQGAVFQVTDTATANQTAVGYGGVTSSTGLYGGVGQHSTATSIAGWGRHSLGGSDAPVIGPAAVVGAIYSVVHISRSRTSHVLYVNGVRYTGSTDASSSDDSIQNFSIGAANRAGAPVFYGKQNVLLGFIHQGYDPGDDWMRNFSLNPWSLFAPLSRRIWVGVASAGGNTLTADVGAFTLSGQDAGLYAGRTVAGGAGSFALSGQDAGLYVGRKITGDAGAFAFTGQDADLVYTQPGVYTLAADAGSFALNGQDASLTYSGATPPVSGGGASGGGSTQNSRSSDFTLSGKRRFEDVPKRRAIDVAAKKSVDAVVAKAEELANAKQALDEFMAAQQRETVSAARLAKAAAMEAKVAEMEANLAILQDDEEVLQLFLQVLKH